MWCDTAFVFSWAWIRRVPDRWCLSVPHLAVELQRPCPYPLDPYLHWHPCLLCSFRRQRWKILQIKKKDNLTPAIIESLFYFSCTYTEEVIDLYDTKVFLKDVLELYISYYWNQYFILPCYRFIIFHLLIIPINLFKWTTLYII